MDDVSLTVAMLHVSDWLCDWDTHLTMEELALACSSGCWRNGVIHEDDEVEAGNAVLEKKGIRAGDDEPRA